MLRNVALGAVIGFALVVLGLSLWGRSAPSAPAPAADAPPAPHVLPPGAARQRPPQHMPVPAETAARAESLRHADSAPDAGP